MKTLEKEKVIIVGTDYNGILNMEEYMEELEALVEADHGIVVGEMIQNNHEPNAKYFIGSGKVKELKEYVAHLEVDVVVIGHELSGIQLRNLEKELDCQVIDRTHLILDIFALRARTKEAQLQVRLAQLEYGKSRLVGSYSLSRTGGGIGTRGPGEQKLEIDRRHISREIKGIKDRLKESKKQEENRRKIRQKRELDIVSLIGYTNAGKSTLMNALLPEGSEESKKVFVKDMLFATLDSTLRKIVLKHGKEILLADTVGFVSHLPTLLVESFHSTLEEIKYAQCLLHVLDGKNEALELQYETTIKVLKDIEAIHIPRITIINKMDGLDKKDLDLPMIEGPKVFVSAKTKEGLEDLKEAIFEVLEEPWITGKLHFTYQEQDLLSEWLDNYPELTVEYRAEGVTLFGKFPPRVKIKYGNRWEEAHV
ncbi:MAG: GTPase HflX [Tissierellia bacterium]|nr:GTPase HflX [Tissierellia bacterium]